LQTHQREFDDMEYAPRTRVPSKGKETKTRIGASRLPDCCDLQGVFINEDVPAFHRERQLVCYSGLLVTEALYAKFQSKYTAPRLWSCRRSLERTRCSCWATPLRLARSSTTVLEVAEMVRCQRKQQHTAAAQAARSQADICFRHAANCALRSVSAAHLQSILTTRVDGKKIVSNQVAAVWTLADLPLSKGVELLLDYGGASFWSAAIHEHCVVCFCRDSNDSCQMTAPSK
jgi:hypothetical protein